MFITIREIIDIVIMTLAIGFIFSRIFKKKPSYTDPVQYYLNKSNFIDDLKYGVTIAAPAIVLHELSHKFMAMAFGAEAVLHAPLTIYIIAIILLLANFPIVFFVGGYVSIIGQLTNWQDALVSVAGPLTNLILWGICILLVKHNIIKKNHYDLLLMAKLNMFLFGFNMIPIPGFDGWNFFTAIIRMFI